MQKITHMITLPKWMQIIFNDGKNKTNANHRVLSIKLIYFKLIVCYVLEENQRNYEIFNDLDTCF